VLPFLSHFFYRRNTITSCWTGRLITHYYNFNFEIKNYTNYCSNYFKQIVNTAEILSLGTLRINRHRLLLTTTAGDHQRRPSLSLVVIALRCGAAWGCVRMTDFGQDTVPFFRETDYRIICPYDSCEENLFTSLKLREHLCVKYNIIVELEKITFDNLKGTL